MFSPIDFADERKRLWAYGAIFFLLGRRILAIFPRGYIRKLAEFSDTEWMEKYGWTACK